jgi:hypothetical protein
MTKNSKAAKSVKKKVMFSLQDTVVEKLNSMADEMAINKSALVTLMISEKYKEKESVKTKLM